MSNECIISIDLGGTFLKSGVITKEGEILEGSIVSAPANSDKSIEDIKKSFQYILKSQLSLINKSGYSLLGVGIDTPGPFDFKNSKSLMQHKFKAIYNIPLKPWVSEITGDIPVMFIHDSSAFIIGEIWSGATKGFENIAGVMIGTGLGFAAVSGNTVLQNKNGGPGISIYRKPFLDSTAEEYVSRRGIIKRYKNRLKNPNIDIDVKDIAEKARNGDINAIMTFKETGKHLGEILKPELEILKTQCLIVGGQISKSFDLFKNALYTALKEVKTLKKISVSSNIDCGHLLGAAAAVLSTYGGQDIIRFSIYSKSLI